MTFYDFEKFLAQIKLARVNARMGELSAEELAKVKAAWEEGRRLVKQEAEAVMYGDSRRPAIFDSRDSSIPTP